MFGKKCVWTGVVLAIAVSLTAGSAQAIDSPEIADVSSTKWSATLEILDRESSGFVRCSGAVVAPQWILTAGHCVEKPDMTQAWASIGAVVNRNYPVKLDKYLVHPDWDVALLHMKTASRDTIGVSPLPLNSGVAARAFGFGEGMILKVASLTSLGIFDDGFLYARPPSRAISEVGDSGGPLVVDGKIFGVLSAAVLSGRGALLPQDFKYVPTWSVADWIEGVTHGKPNPGATKPSVPTVVKPGNKQPSAVPVVGRVYGPDRVGTSLAAWNAGKFNSHTVVIATGRLAPDALAAGPLAASLNAPLVLTTAPYIEPTIVSLLRSRRISDIRLVGGQVDFAPADWAALRASKVKISRYFGANRYQTAVVVAKAAIVAWERQGFLRNPVLVADGLNFPDALSAGTAAANIHGVVVLSAGAAMPSETYKFLRSRVGQSSAAYAVGGPAVHALLSRPVPNLGVQSVQGSNRYQTAQQVAKILTPFAASAVVASGVDFPDGLAAAPLAAKRGSCLLLTNPWTLPPPTASYLARLPNRKNSLIMGGPGAIADSVASQVRK